MKPYRANTISKSKPPTTVKLNPPNSMPIDRSLTIPQGYYNPTLASIRSLKKKAFLEIFYACDGNIQKACYHTGISRPTFYNWLNKDARFAQLVKEQENQLNDEMRDILIKKAKKDRGTTELIFYLKSRHPDFKPQKETIGYRQGNVQWVMSRGI